MKTLDERFEESLRSAAVEAIRKNRRHPWIMWLGVGVSLFAILSLTFIDAHKLPSPILNWLNFLGVFYLYILAILGISIYIFLQTRKIEEADIFAKMDEMKDKFLREELQRIEHDIRYTEQSMKDLEDDLEDLEIDRGYLVSFLYDEAKEA